jgi:hypothetical protein
VGMSTLGPRLGKIRQEGQVANDLIRQPRELNEDPSQKDIVATTLSSPIEKDISRPCM